MCAVDWSLVADAVAAFGSLSAAIVALYIASRDRHDRKQERNAAELAQAELVRVNVDWIQDSSEFSVRIRNYGDRAIIGVAVDSAHMRKPSDARWIDELGSVLDVVQPERDAPSGGVLPLRFVDSAGDRIPKIKALIGDNMTPLFEDFDKHPIVVVHFMDANGCYWKTGPQTAPERANRAMPQQSGWPRGFCGKL